MTTFVRKHWVALALLSLTLFGLFIRLYHIDFQCFSWDEEFTRNLAITNNSYIVGFSLGVDINPPLYYLIAHWSALAFGDASYYAMRFPAAIFGTLCIPAVFYIGKEFYNDLLGFVCAVYIAISYPMIFYSNFARSYTLVFLAFAIVTYYFIRLYRGDNHTSSKLMFAIFAAVALWSHLYSLVPIAFLCIALLTKHKLKMLPWIALIGIWCLPFLLYISKLQHRIHETFGGTWWQVLYMLPIELLWIPSVVVVPLFIYSSWKHREDSIFTLFGITSIATATFCVVMTQITPTFPRYALLVSPMILVVALHPVIQFIERYNAERRVALILVVGFLILACNYTSLVAWYFIRDCVYA
jgi:uncharacterized membrane protein